MDKQERKKELMDILVFVFFFIWLFMRILSYTSDLKMNTFLFISKVIIILAALLVALFVLPDSDTFVDEFEISNRNKAYKFSWFFLILETAVIYVLSKAKYLDGQLVIEIILWSGYLSYFISYKFYDLDLGSKFQERTLKKIKKTTTSSIQILFGGILGLTILSVNPIKAEKMLYIVSGSFFLLIGLSLHLYVYFRAKKRGKKK